MTKFTPFCGGGKSSWLYPMVVTAVATGMRLGEVLAVRWRDVDFDGEVIRVEQSLEETQSGRCLRFKSPKTKYGRRNIALAPSVVAELRRHWALQGEQRLACGVGKALPDDLVFPDGEFKPRKPNNVSRAWAQIIRARKLPRVTFHGPRHTHVSQLIASGMDVLTISRRIGHSNPNITLGVYGHLFRNTDSQAAAVIEAAFGGALTE